MAYELIPEELKAMKRWVCVINGCKVPFMSTIDRAASPTDPRTWGTFENAVKAVREDDYDGLGFVFADDGIVGIDIDAGFNENGTISDLALDIIEMCKSYTERSRSGRGFHILLRGVLPIKGKNNGRGVEIYQSGRYFITTGNRFGKESLVRFNQAAIDKILAKYFPEVKRESAGKKSTEKLYKPEWIFPGGGRVPLIPHYPEIKKGSRNTSLLSLGGNLIQCGWQKDLILDEMMRCNQTACKPPLSESEVRAIWKSVCRYERV